MAPQSWLSQEKNWLSLNESTLGRTRIRRMIFVSFSILFPFLLFHLPKGEFTVTFLFILFLLSLPTSFYFSTSISLSLDDFLCLSISPLFSFVHFSPSHFLWVIPFLIPFLCFSWSVFISLRSFIFFLFLITLRSSLFCSSPFSWCFSLLFPFRQNPWRQRVLINWRVMPNITFLGRASKRHVFLERYLWRDQSIWGIFFEWLDQLQWLLKHLSWLFSFPFHSMYRSLDFSPFFCCYTSMGFCFL